MPIYSERELPFPRGQTFNQDGLLTLTDTYYSHLEGTIYRVRDTVHGTGVPIYLMIVKNDSGGSLTVARRCLRFSTTDEADWGRRVAGWQNAAGKVSVPMDDAYLVGATIAQYDLFYVVVRGWCYINTESTTVDLHRGVAVAIEANGYIEGAASGATAGQFAIGTVDERVVGTSIATRVFVDLDIRMPYGS